MTASELARDALALAGGLLAAATVAAAAARAGRNGPLAMAIAASVLALPALALVLGATGEAATLGGLAVLLLPVLALGMRRVDPAMWRMARDLGASRSLAARTVVLPELAASLLLAAGSGAGVLVVRAVLRSASVPAP